MDFTLIADCGAHSTKYAGQAKRNRRKDWSENQVREMPSPHVTGGTESSAFWHQALSTLVSKEVEDGEDLTLVLLVDTFASRGTREHLFQQAFEHLGAKKVAMCCNAANALFAAGETSGVTVDIGYSAVRMTPIDRGVPMPWLATTLPAVGCAALDRAVHACLTEAHPQTDSLLSESCQRFLRDPTFTAAKSKLCGFRHESLLRSGRSQGSEGDAAAVAALNAMASSPPSCDFILPDGSVVSVPHTEETRVRVTRPLLFCEGLSAPASFRAVYQKFCVAQADVSVGQWALCGGGAAVAGVDAELAAGISGSLFGLPERQLTLRNPLAAAVEGSVILTHLTSFKGMCVSVAEYEEDGPAQCVHVKTVDAR